ncbi:prepilin peptidase [Halorientalis pallida]|uniref:Prepilin peptidase n=1 Tax=Halorientalis pallida TaxID=2479928 RepID=A0A498KZA7_9EURY|nr:prepilin peptidase [Halorientalis pallida]RXK50628.1 prepilin peptidase [Halorientalis pallida]
MTASVPDLLRLVAVPVLGWAAWRDVKTRRVPNRTWLPLLGVALLALALEAWQVWTGTTVGYVNQQAYFLRTTISLGFVIPLAYGFWWIGGFGGADAKALITLAVLFPTFPTYLFPDFALPVVVPTLGVFAMTVLSNTVVVGLFYPVALTLRNAAGGHVAKAMVIGRPVATERVTEEYGRLLQTPDGFTRRGLDLDALRMYLAWRGASFAALRADPEEFRDPASIPAETNPPGDGAIAVPDGGRARPEEDAGADDPSVDADDEARPDEGEITDPWGAERFFEEIEGSAYGTTPEQLREGLTVLTADDEVWITPGIPFLVPMFLGLLLGLSYGDVLYAVIEGLGVF